MLDAAPPPTYVKAVGFKGKIDRWQEFEYVLRGAVLQMVRARWMWARGRLKTVTGGFPPAPLPRHHAGDGKHVLLFLVGRATTTAR